jgi:hypothetical protein
MIQKERLLNKTVDKMIKNTMINGDMSRENDGIWRQPRLEEGLEEEDSQSQWRPHDVECGSADCEASKKAQTPSATVAARVNAWT